MEFLWNINKYRFRLSLTSLYSIDEYKDQSSLFYLKYFVLYELLPVLQSVDILHFLNSLALISSSF